MDVTQKKLAILDYTLFQVMHQVDSLIGLNPEIAQEMGTLVAELIGKADRLSAEYEDSNREERDTIPGDLLPDPAGEEGNPLAGG